MKKVFIFLISMCFALTLFFGCAHRASVKSESVSDHYSLDFDGTIYFLPKEIPDFRSWPGEMNMEYDNNDPYFRIVSFLGCEPGSNGKNCVFIIVVGHALTDGTKKSGIVIVIVAKDKNVISCVDENFFKTGILSHTLNITNRIPTKEDILKHEKASGDKRKISFSFEL